MRKPETCPKCNIFMIPEIEPQPEVPIEEYMFGGEKILSWSCSKCSTKIIN
ncbi:MAG: hypothetical protein AABY22_09330 [Nanoarchaeota archaeon]